MKGAEEDNIAINRLTQELIDARKSRGLRQRDVAVLMGTDQGAVSRFERGKHVPLVSTIQDYCRAVGKVLLLQVGDQE